MSEVMFLTGKYENEKYDQRTLLSALSQRGVEVELIHPDYADCLIQHDGQPLLFYDKKPIKFPKRVMARMIRNPIEWDMGFHRQLDIFGARCFNTPASMDRTRNKLHTYQILAKHGVAIPRTMVLHAPTDFDLIAEQIGFPCVLKIHIGGHGSAVYLCWTRSEFEIQVEFIQQMNFQVTFLVQEFIQESSGSDLRVFVVGGRTVGAMRRIAPEGEFRANLVREFREDRYRTIPREVGGRAEPFAITPEIDEIASKTATILGLDIAGIDLLWDSRGIRVCEANCVPEFKNYDFYCGTGLADIIIDHVLSA